MNYFKILLLFLFIYLFIYLKKNKQNYLFIIILDLPDLILDTFLLEESAYIEDRSIMFLQCAMEENCLSKSAYEIDKSDPSNE